jgi:hypothetical protein
MATTVAASSSGPGQATQEYHSTASAPECIYRVQGLDLSPWCARAVASVSLLPNAASFTGKSIQLSVTGSGRGNTLTMTIKDTGLGSLGEAERASAAAEMLSHLVVEATEVWKPRLLSEVEMKMRQSDVVKESKLSSKNDADVNSIRASVEVELRAEYEMR